MKPIKWKPPLSSHLGIRCSLPQIEYWLRRLYSEKRRGILATQKDGHGSLLVDQARQAAETFFEQIQLHTNLNSQTTQKRINEPLAIESDYPAKLARLCDHIKQLADSIENEDTQAELRSLRSRGLEIRDSLEAFLNQTLSGHVYWIERQGRRRLPVLLSAPINVGPILREALFEPTPCVILTSATLAVGGELNYFLQRIGGEACSPLQVGSPFDYSRQMHLQLPTEFPRPIRQHMNPVPPKPSLNLYINHRPAPLFSSQIHASCAMLPTNFATNSKPKATFFLFKEAGSPPAKCLNHSANTPQAFSLDSIVSGWVSMFKAMPSAT